MNIFEKASRQALRFKSVKGLLTTEHLWELPLTSKNGCDLDTIARGVNTELKGVTEESFVVSKPDARKAPLELQLEILKHIIAAKLADAEEKKNQAANAEKRKKILAALASREDEEMSKKPKDELLAELEKLS